MPQATITLRLQAAGKDETFSKTLSEEHTGFLINGLLRNDSAELRDQFPNQGDRVIELYKQWQKQIHNDLMATEERRSQSVTTGWT